MAQSTFTKNFDITAFTSSIKNLTTSIEENKKSNISKNTEKVISFFESFLFSRQKELEQMTLEQKINFFSERFVQAFESGDDVRQHLYIQKLLEVFEKEDLLSSWEFEGNEIPNLKVQNRKVMSIMDKLIENVFAKKQEKLEKTVSFASILREEKIEKEKQETVDAVEEKQEKVVEEKQEEAVVEEEKQEEVAEEEKKSWKISTKKKSSKSTDLIFQEYEVFENSHNGNVSRYRMFKDQFERRVVFEGKTFMYLRNTYGEDFTRNICNNKCVNSKGQNVNSYGKVLNHPCDKFHIFSGELVDRVYNLEGEEIQDRPIVCSIRDVEDFEDLFFSDTEDQYLPITVIDCKFDKNCKKKACTFRHSNNDKNYYKFSHGKKYLI